MAFSAVDGFITEVGHDFAVFHAKILTKVGFRHIRRKDGFFIQELGVGESRANQQAADHLIFSAELTSDFSQLGLIEVGD